MKGLEHQSVDKQDVRKLTDVQLARLGIRLLNKEELIIQCVTCGETWSPALDASGRLPFRYWLCPAKCNQ